MQNNPMTRMVLSSSSATTLTILRQRPGAIKGTIPSITRTSAIATANWCQTSKPDCPLKSYAHKKTAGARYNRPDYCPRDCLR